MSLFLSCVPVVRLRSQIESGFKHRKAGPQYSTLFLVMLKFLKATNGFCSGYKSRIKRSYVQHMTENLVHVSW